MAQTVTSRLATTGRIRTRRALQRVRAVRHHAAAVLREFRAPILGFAFVTVVGGFVYGELYRVARGVHIPVIDRPYVMVQLMILEAPENVPPEWYLVAFWYVLPAVLVFLIGLGAADFVELFFNRSENRDAWGEALAMTYRNHAIVLGAGHVGLRVVRDLVDMGTDVVVIDHSLTREKQETLSRLGVPVVVGDGRLAKTQEKAGLASADAFVACTASDQVNMEAVLKARDANPVVRIVVRMWDKSFAEQMQRFMKVQSVISAADLSAPAFAGAAVGIEITQTLDINGTEYSTIRLTVGPGSFLDGEPVGRLEEANDMEIVLHGRNGQADVDPPPDRVIQVGDDLVIFASHERILDVVSRNRRRRSA